MGERLMQKMMHFMKMKPNENRRPQCLRLIESDICISGEILRNKYVI